MTSPWAAPFAVVLAGNTHGEPTDARSTDAETSTAPRMTFCLVSGMKMVSASTLALAVFAVAEVEARPALMLTSPGRGESSAPLQGMLRRLAEPTFTCATVQLVTVPLLPPGSDGSMPVATAVAEALAPTMDTGTSRPAMEMLAVATCASADPSESSPARRESADP